MGYSHHYDIIKEVGDTKDQPQHIHTPRSTSWRTFLLCNLFAAGLGAAVMFLIMRASFEVQSNNVAEAAASIATPTAPPAVLTLPPAADHVEGDIQSPDSEPGNILDCGGNPDEARAKGCVYDVMMQDWVPEPCYDRVLTERYLAEGNWTWYADGEGKTIMSDEDMRKGEHGVAWMSTSYHKAHCVFSWLKIIRALRNGRGISQELMSYDHVLHCSHGALRENSDDQNLGVAAPTNYARCALYETWKIHPIQDKHDSTE